MLETVGKEIEIVSDTWYPLSSYTSSTK